MGFRIFDVSDPSNASLLSEVPTLGTMMEFDVVGTTLYASEGDSGLEIFDVSDPSNPVAIGMYSEPGFFAQDVVVNGARAYVNGGENLKIFDVSDPTSPAALGSYLLPSGSDPTSVFGDNLSVIEDIVYLLDGLYSEIGFVELLVIDAGDPTSPTLQGSLQIKNPLNSMAVLESSVFLSDASTGLITVDATNTCDAVCPLDNECPADMNNDGVLNAFDISVFLTLFAQHDPRADFTCDGNFNFFDISAWLGEFLAGCW